MITVDLYCMPYIEAILALFSSVKPATMASSTPSQRNSPAFNQPTNIRIFVPGPSPTFTLDCDSFVGVPLLPSSKRFVCGTKTNNNTRMQMCCNGAEVIESLGCFQHCEMENFNPSDMRAFVACLSNGDNTTSQVDADAVDTNVFCQGQLNSTIDAQSSSASKRSGSKATGFFVCIMMVALLFCQTVVAECTITIEEGSGLVRQGEARGIGAGTRCSTGSPYCIIDQTGTNSFIAANRTIVGGDASNRQYDEFFEALGDSTDPPRLFAASSTMEIHQWTVGVADDNLVNYSFWAPFMVSQRQYFFMSCQFEHC